MLFVAIPKYTQFLDQFNWWVTGPHGVLPGLPHAVLHRGSGGRDAAFRCASGGESRLQRGRGGAAGRAPQEQMGQKWVRSIAIWGKNHQ